MFCFVKNMFNFACIIGAINNFFCELSRTVTARYSRYENPERIQIAPEHLRGSSISGSMLRERKIHKGLATRLVKNKSRLRAFSIYLDLLTLTKNRVFFDFQKRIPQLSRTLGMCPKTFKKWMKVILNNGWAKVDGSTLRITGRRKTAKLIGEVSEKDYHIIDAHTFKDIEPQIRALAIEENKKAQYHKLKEKVIDKEIKSVKIICKGIKKKFAKTLNHVKLIDKLRAVNILTDLNKQFTLSRKGLAGIYGLNSPQSGTYWAIKMKKYITDERQEPVFLGAMAVGYFRELQLASKRYLYMENGMCYCRLPNHLSLKTLRLQSISK